MVNRADHSEGVLIDLDIAARVNEQGTPVNRDELPVAGTIEFRACDLVIPEKPKKAYYRHDLESFFYTLVWIQLHYQNGVYYQHPEAETADFGFRGSWEATRDYKQGFLHAYNDKEDQLPWTSLRDAWLTPLREYFGKAFNAEHNAAIATYRGVGSLLDEKTLGGEISFEKFVKILDHCEV